MSARSVIDEQLIDQAIAWQQALAHDDADWDGYLAWLEADPRHRQAFDEVALLDRAVDEHSTVLRRVVVPLEGATAAKRPQRRLWITGSLAAAVAFAVGIPALWERSADTIYTTARESRQIALDDGSSIYLAPSSKLIAVGGNSRKLELAEGEAFFSVRHDPSRTLSIKAGDYAVTDIGTKFGVTVAPGAVTVAVAEGNVAVGNDTATANRLSAGQQLIARHGRDMVTVRPVSPADVGSWRHGRLVYNKTPLAIVAADLTRYSGKTVSVDPALREIQFSGILAIGDGSRLVQNLAAIMSLGYKADGDTVRLVAASAP
jgi:transmembrane sensor